MTQDPAWIQWLAAALGCVISLAVYFFWLELPGLRPNKGPLTLSWSIRRWMGIYPRTKRSLWTIPLFTVLMFGCLSAPIWFWLHIIFEGRGKL